MSELVEYYPFGVYGLHWEATALDAEEEIRGIVLAEAEDGRIALGHIEDRSQVVFLTADELACLYGTLASGELDYLLAGSRGVLHPPQGRPTREELFAPFSDWSGDSGDMDGSDRSEGEASGTSGAFGG